MSDTAVRLLLVHGPNLNLLGSREPGMYGSQTLVDIEDVAVQTAADLGLEVRAVQSNHEGVLLDAIHTAREDCDGIVINAGALSHTSIAIRDALSAVGLPVVEVHISNVHRREEFRHHSYVSAVAEAVIVGAGIHGYEYAVRHLAHLLGRAGAARLDDGRVGQAIAAGRPAEESPDSAEHGGG